MISITSYILQQNTPCFRHDVIGKEENQTGGDDDGTAQSYEEAFGGEVVVEKFGEEEGGGDKYKWSKEIYTIIY